MARIIKLIGYIFAGLLVVVLVAALGFYLLFDANDYKETVTQKVREETGRELVIAGDVSISYFPWLAVDVGETSLGNGPGFGLEPFASFDSARLSVKLWPLLRKEIQIGRANVDGLVMHLAVAKSGRGNWDDLVADDETTTKAAGDGQSEAPKLEAAGFDLNNATIIYSDAQDGSYYSMTALNMRTGAISDAKRFSFDAEFDFDVERGEYTGHSSVNGTATLDSKNDMLVLDDLAMSGKVSGVAPKPAAFEMASDQIRIDIAEEQLVAEEIKAHLLGITFEADLEPLSYAGMINPRADIRVERFSLKQLMRALDIEPPETADPSAMERLELTASANLGETTLTLNKAVIKLDDSIFKGKLVIPLTDTGSYRFELAGDSMDFDRYMEPTSTGGAGGSSGDSVNDVEIPVDLIRTLQAVGTIKLDRAQMSGLAFESLVVGLNSGGGKLRLQPLSASLFGGAYQGDVQVNAAGKVPVLSVNERVENIQIQALMKSVFERDDVTGTFRGNFTLRGAGMNMAAIRRDLDGNIGLELLDGAWQGTDIWHELRTARARLMQQPVPEPRKPPRTEFSSVSASGAVKKGIFSNNDLLAELPFLRLTGSGTVDLVSTEVDYSMQARVMEKPEFVRGATEEELNEFTGSVIPLRISGPLTSPKVRPDVQAMVKARVKEEVQKKTDDVKKRLLDKIIGTRAQPEQIAPVEQAPVDPAATQAPPAEPSTTEPATADKPAADAEPPPPEPEKLTPEEELKKKLKDLFKS